MSKGATFPKESRESTDPQSGRRIRQVTRRWAVDLGFSLVDQTKIVTAASELARNTFVHGGGGVTLIEDLEEGARRVIIGSSLIKDGSIK